MPTGKPCSEMSNVWPPLRVNHVAKSAVLVVVFEEQHFACGPGLREDVRAGESAKTAADDDHVILVGHSFASQS